MPEPLAVRLAQTRFDVGLEPQIWGALGENLWSLFPIWPNLLRLGRCDGVATRNLSDTTRYGELTNSLPLFDFDDCTAGNLGTSSETIWVRCHWLSNTAIYLPQLNPTDIDGLVVWGTSCNLQPRRASQLTHYTCILRCPIIADMTESQPNSLATSRTIQFLDLVALAAMCRLFRTEALDLDKPSATS
ncbi:hypothetical protein CGCF413_v005129 [Colletotrichum fructicola]|nr:hypothetical protein CGCF413_v005129 [Colletotrichum fructicola]